MGIILYEFLVGCVPFFGDTPEELFGQVVSGKNEGILTINLEFNHDWNDFCLVDDKMSREGSHYPTLEKEHELSLKTGTH